MAKRYRLPLFATRIGLPMGSKEASPDGWFYPTTLEEQAALEEAGCQADDTEDPVRNDGVLRPDQVAATAALVKGPSAVPPAVEDYVSYRVADHSVASAYFVADRIANDREAAGFLQKATLGGGVPEEIQALTALGSKKAWVNAEFAKNFPQRFMDFAYFNGASADVSAANPFIGFGSRDITDQTFCTFLASEAAPLRAKCLHALTRLFQINVNGGAFDDHGRWVSWLSWWDRLNTHVFGNWRDLIESVTYSLHMARMLTYYGNEKETAVNQPDENYAREIMQLFSIGLFELNMDGTYKLDAAGNKIPTYTNNDIRQVARCMTGLTNWEFNNTTQKYDVDDSISRAKAVENVLGSHGVGLFADANYRLVHYLPFYEYRSKNALNGLINIPDGTDPVTNLRMVHDALFNHPNTAPFFAVRMIQTLVTSNPSPAYVSRVSAAFADNGQGVRGDLRAVWLAILTDPEANEDGRYNPDFGKVKDGFEVFMSLVRPLRRRNSNNRISLGRDNVFTTFASNYGPTSPRIGPSIFGPYDPLHTPTEYVGLGPEQRPLLLPEVQIWSDVLLARAMSENINIVILGERGDANGVNGQVSNYAVLGVVGTWADTLAGTPAALVERLNLLQCGGKMGPALRANIEATITGMPTSTATEQDNRVAVALQLITNSPDFFVQL